MNAISREPLVTTTNAEPDAASMSTSLDEIINELFAQAYKDHGIDPNSPDARERVSRLMRNPARAAKLRDFKDTL